MITVVINGQSFDYPVVGDTDWGNAATVAFQSLAATTLQKDAGAFTLENELDFGGNYGVKVLFISSRSNDPALSGVFRLSKGELVAWRNEDNDGDNTITFDADGDLIVNGVKVTLHGQIVNADIAAGAGIEESKLALDYSTDSLHTLISDKALYNLADTDLPDPTATPPDTPPNNQDVLLYDNNDSKWKNSNLLSSHVGNNSNPHLTNLVNLVDTTVVTPTKDDTLLYDDADSKWKNKPNTVTNLKDTAISTPLSGQVLTYDGNDSTWKNQPSASASLTGLTDTDISTTPPPDNGDVLSFDSNDLKWKNSNALTSHLGDKNNPHDTSVSKLTDTNIFTPINNMDVLAYDDVAGEWTNTDYCSVHVNDTNNPHDTSISNLDDTTITTPSDQDTIVYDNNSGKWINQANTINNIGNVSIDTNTLAVGDALVFDDQDSLWKNDASFTNHIGNTSNPHLTTVGKLTDTSITTPANKDVLLYDYANSQWINSDIININDNAYIGTTPQGHTVDANNNVTMLVTDNRTQILTATDGYGIILPSTGIKAGEKFTFVWFGDSWWTTLTTPFVFRNPDLSANKYAWVAWFVYSFTALVDNPSSSTDWDFDAKHRITRTTSNWGVASTTKTLSWSANNRASGNSNTIITLSRGVWNVKIDIIGGCTGTPLVNNYLLLRKNINGIESDVTDGTGMKLGMFYRINMPCTDGTSMASLYQKTAIIKFEDVYTPLYIGYSYGSNTAESHSFKFAISATLIAPIVDNIT